jgi:hypothetical protein
MVLIFLSWIYILITTIHLGFIFDKLIGLKNKNFVITTVLGLFFATILGSIWAVFGRIHIEFHVFLLALNLFVFIRFKSNVLEIYKSFIIQFKGLTKSLKIFLVFNILLIIAQCSAKPFIIDNESYYIQTIKWINEYGFVKGLANLHIFFGQTSGWHITQSVFNFSFLYSNFNDLSGFCLMIGTVFAVLKLNKYFENNNKTYLIIGLLPLANVLLFQFISAPSSDLPIYIFSFMLFFYFIEFFNNYSIQKFNLIVILSLFLVYLKPTALVMLLFPVILFITNFKLLKNKIGPSFILSLLILSLMILKNTIITGYPLYPTQIFSGTNFDFKVSKDVVSYFFNGSARFGFYTTQDDFNSMTYLDIFVKWLFVNNINVLFFLMSVLLVILCCYFINKFYNKKVFWLLYSVFLFQFGFLLFTSPQYRFFIHFLLFFGFLIFVCFVYSKKTVLFLLFGSTFIVTILVIIPLNYSVLTSNKHLSKNSRFSISEIIFPHKNTKNTTSFEQVKSGNLKFNSPIDNSFFWGNGDGKLPCVNKVQIEYFEQKFHYIPQMRTKDLKDGFYSKKVSENE